MDPNPYEPPNPTSDDLANAKRSADWRHDRFKLLAVVACLVVAIFGPICLAFFWLVGF